MKMKPIPLMTCDVCGKERAHIRYLTRSYGKGANLFVIEDVPVVCCSECGANYITAETAHEIARIKLHRKAFAVQRSVAVAEFAYSSPKVVMDCVMSQTSEVYHDSLQLISFCYRSLWVYPEVSILDTPRCVKVTDIFQVAVTACCGILHGLILWSTCACWRNLRSGCERLFFKSTLVQTKRNRFA